MRSIGTVSRKIDETVPTDTDEPTVERSRRAERVAILPRTQATSLAPRRRRPIGQVQRHEHTQRQLQRCPAGVERSDDQSSSSTSRAVDRDPTHVEPRTSSPKMACGMELSGHHIGPRARVGRRGSAAFLPRRTVRAATFNERNFECDGTFQHTRRSSSKKAPNSLAGAARIQTGRLLTMFRRMVVFLGVVIIGIAASALPAWAHVTVGSDDSAEGWQRR